MKITGRDVLIGSAGAAVGSALTFGGQWLVKKIQDSGDKEDKSSKKKSS